MTLYELYGNACAQDAVDELYAAAQSCAMDLVCQSKETK